MMGALHDDARAREEPAAILTASESVIYGRFGYGCRDVARRTIAGTHAREVRAPDR